MQVITTFDKDGTDIAAGVTQTLVQILAATNHPLKITEVSVSFDGIDNLAEPVTVQLLIQTSAGTASAATPVKVTRTDSTTITGTAQITFTGEPSASNILRTWRIHPQGTPWVYTFPDPAALELASAERLGLRVIVPSGAPGVEPLGYIEWIE